MKRLLLLLVCSFITIAASAQYAVNNVPVLKGSRVYVDGEKIPHEEVMAYLVSEYDFSVADRWAAYRSAYKAGLGLTIAGTSLALCSGVVFTGGILTAAGTAISIPILGSIGIIAGNMKPVTDNINNGMSTADKLITIGGCGALAGLAMIASGIPTLCVYKKRLNSTFDEYMSGISSDAYMAFGPTANGIGFALNF